MVAETITLSASSLFADVRVTSKRPPLVELADILPSLRRPPKRTNRLRQKLLETLKPLTHEPIAESPPTFEEFKEDEPQELQNAEFPKPLSIYRNGSEKGDFFGMFLASSLILVGFLALQAAIAVWVFRKDVDESAFLEVNKKEQEKDILFGEGDEEFKKKVLSIQKMAKEAREVEMRKGSGNGGSSREGKIIKEVKRKLGKITNSVAQIPQNSKSFRRTHEEISQEKEIASGMESISKTASHDGGSHREGKTIEEVKRKLGKINKKVPQIHLNSKSFRRTSEEIGQEKEIVSREESILETASQDENISLNGSHSKSDAVDNVWWLKLSYVMAIFLHRGSDRKKFRGLYSLKFDSDSSLTVVFEDRSDATNFSYLLEAFFENLEDFSADVVPLSTKELHNAVRSESLKVFVVKKGLLRLYAGQPLAEAEMQLHSIME